MVALDKNYSDIIWKDGVGTYSYDSLRPHAMTATSGDGKIYKYDANGNIKQRGGNSIWWTAFNKTRSIFADNGAGYTFYYDANHSRVLETVVAGDLKSWNKFFVGGLYEEQHKDGKIEKRHFIPTPAGVIGVWSTSTDPHTPASRDYRVNDHLGSASVIVGEGGRDDIRDEYSYDSWGNPRSVTNWSVGLSNWPSYLANRGFTGHEMLEEIELIHMNARIYDPVLGKFLSPDTYIQFEHNLQSYNRYSYVINNPLRYTDPSGNFVFTLAATAWLASGGTISAIGTFWTTVAVMAAAGFADALVQGATIGQALKAGAIAGATAAITKGIGGKFDARAAKIKAIGEMKTALGLHASAVSYTKNALMMNAMARALTHGVVQGAMADAMGGKFGPSALAGFTSSVGGSLQGASGIGDYPVASTLTAAVVGGTVSEIGGGKFSNGAISGAMVHALNYHGGSQGKDYLYVEESAANTLIDVESLNVDGTTTVEKVKLIDALEKQAEALNAEHGDYFNEVIVRTYKTPAHLKRMLERNAGSTVNATSISHGSRKNGIDTVVHYGLDGKRIDTPANQYKSIMWHDYGCRSFSCIPAAGSYINTEEVWTHVSRQFRSRMDR